MKIVEIKDLKKNYVNGEIEAKILRGINLSINKGEITTILGASGAGKTTLLNIISGLESATSGDVLIDGFNITKASKNEKVDFRRNNVGFIFQQYNLVKDLSVWENIELSAFLNKDSFDIQEIIDAVGLKGFENKLPADLSGGQQQRVAIARAIVKNAKILFCDEPTGALDEETSKVILEIIKEINTKYGVTMIMITHNPSIRYMSHKTITINSGNISSEENRSEEQLVNPSDLDWGYNED